MFSKYDRLQGFDNALLAAISTEEQRNKLENPAVIERARGQVANLCASFPVYAD